MRIPVKRKRIELTGEFVGLWVEIRSSLLMGTLEDLQEAGTSRDTKRIRQLLTEITLASNFEDEAGAIDVTAADGWRRVPSDLLNEVMTQVNEGLAPPKETSTGSTTSSSSETPSTSPATTT